MPSSSIRPARHPSTSATGVIPVISTTNDWSLEQHSAPEQRWKRAELFRVATEVDIEMDLQNDRLAFFFGRISI